MTRVTASQNKARGKQDERDVARIIGGKRHPADSGGCEDIEHPELCIQVKGGLRVINDTVRNGLQAARSGAQGTSKLPAVVVVDRSGTRIRRFIVFGLEDWAAYHGYPKGASDDDADC